MTATAAPATQAEETVIVHATTAVCDGGGGPLGHPKVYLDLAEVDEVVCPYCSRKFVIDPEARKGAAH